MPVIPHDEYVRVHRSVNAQPEERARLLYEAIKKANDDRARLHTTEPFAPSAIAWLKSFF